MSASNLVSWLRFDSSPTADKSGETWQAIGNPTISDNALQLDGSSCLKLYGGLYLGGQDFTIRGKATMASTAQRWGGLFALNGNNLRLIRYDNTSSAFERGYKTKLARLNVSPELTTRFDFEIDYEHATGTWRTFFNGELIETYTNSLARTYYANVFIGGNGDNATTGGGHWGGTIEEFQIFDGVALHTENFTPPTAADYAALATEYDALGTNVAIVADVERIVRNKIAVSFAVDVERKVKNKWRYVNMGDVHDLTQTQSYLTNLPEDKSKTGVAFYQTTRAKCFDIPATPEIWAKFDVYFDGSNRWRAFNGGDNSNPYNVGITAQTSGNLSLVQNSAVKQSASGICKTNQLQTVLLHMVSGTNGLIEAWVDGTKIYTFNGDVNHGDDFADFYLQSDGAGTFFSNVIISNSEIGLNDGWQKISIDAERQIKKPVQITLDVQRELITTIVVPLIGSHFNHLVNNITIFSGSSQRIVLPKRSSAYIRGTGIGSIKVSSDTDATGTVTGVEAFNAGEMYAELGECETVRIAVDSTATSPQQIIKAFVSSLTKTTLQGTAAVDEAINYATLGRVKTATEVGNAFLDDLNNANSETIFLRDKCGIFLVNADTGAITGSDAGGSTVKTASSVVPEQISVTNWSVPESATTIRGLTIHWARFGANGDVLSDTEKHILAGLNSDWIEQSLILIEESFGINFYGENTILRDINVKFEDNENNALAYVKPYYSDSRLAALDLVINMYYYNDIDTTNEDGSLISSSPLYGSAGYLDRTLAHEFTHAVMLANISDFQDLPLYIQEGMAELVHGIDDLRGQNIMDLLYANKSLVKDIFRTGGATGGVDTYCAGYVFLRYLAKQNAGISFTPNEIEITDLLISDGATDSNYEALTDNTRQILSHDIVSTLIKSISQKFGVEIFDVILTEVLLNVERSIPYILNLSRPNQITPTRTKNKPQSRSMPQKTRAASPIQSINGIKDFSVTISEQQIITTISFTTLDWVYVGADVEVSFLNQEIKTKISSVTYDGQFYHAQCNGNVEKLLYTEICTYDPKDKDTGWVVVDDDNININDDDTEDTTLLPRVSANLNKIIRSSGFKINCNIDDYYTTIDYSNTPMVTTPYDLIRDMIGWTSRTPNHMVNILTTCDSNNNVIINFIERGMESGTFELNFDKENPDNGVLFSKFTITDEIEHTAWGSSVNSKTEFRQSTIQKATPHLSVINDISSELQELPEMPEAPQQVIDTGEYPELTPPPVLPTLPKRPISAKVNYITDSDDAHKSKETKSKSKFEYTDDDLIKRSETIVEGEDEVTKTITEYYYETLPTGRKFLAQEVIWKYVGDTANSLILEEQTTIDHTPLMQGQEHVAKSDENGDTHGTSVGQVIPDARVSTYLANKWIEDWRAYSKEYRSTLQEIGQLMSDWALENLEAIQNLDDERSNIVATNILNWNSWLRETSEKLLEISNKFSGGIEFRDESYTDIEEKQLKEKRTISGWTLNDYSLPLAKKSLGKVAARVRALNGATKSTLKVAVYGFNEWITFENDIHITGIDAITGKYYLASNVTTIIPSSPYTIQDLTLVCWDNVGDESYTDDVEPLGAITMLTDAQIEILEEIEARLENNSEE